MCTRVSWVDRNGNASFRGFWPHRLQDQISTVRACSKIQYHIDLQDASVAFAPFRTYIQVAGKGVWGLGRAQGERLWPRPPC